MLGAPALGLARVGASSAGAPPRWAARKDVPRRRWVWLPLLCERNGRGATPLDVRRRSAGAARSRAAVPRSRPRGGRRGRGVPCQGPGVPRWPLRCQSHRPWWPPVPERLVGGCRARPFRAAVGVTRADASVAVWALVPLLRPLP